VCLYVVIPSINTIQDMKTFSIKRAINTKVVVLDTLIRESLTLLEFETADYPVKIYFDPIGEHIKVLVDKIYIQQVILNMTSLILQSMKAANTTLPRLMFEIELNGNTAVNISITHNGPSLSEMNAEGNEELSLIAISQTVIAAHGGKIEINKLDDSNSHFTFSLPLAAP